MPPVREIPTLSGFVCKLRGISQPVLADATDGLRYVVKFGNHPLGSNLLFNESIGTELYRLAGLLVPAWTPLEVSQRFLDKNRGCWIETERGVESPRTGLCFGSCYLGGGGIRLYELLPKSHYLRVRNRGDFWLAWLLDACATHTDNRQAVFCQGFDGKYSGAFIDHGHMFGGPNGEKALPLAASAYLDRRIYPAFSLREAEVLARRVLRVDYERLWKQAEGLLEEWRTETAFARLSTTLNRLPCSSTIESVLDALIVRQSQADISTDHDEAPERKSIASILRPGVQGATTRGCVVA